MQVPFLLNNFSDQFHWKTCSNYINQQEILEEKVLRLELELLAPKERETNQLATKNVMYRTCSEARAADPSLTMGNYWIDPDGQGVGDDPIFVYCDMATGTKKG
jgi:hypothetical protein